MKYLSYLLLLLPSVLWAQAEEPAYYIHSIYFGGGSYYIGPEQIKEFEEWFETIPNIENCEISVHGHTDDIGGVEYNQWLSQMRTESATLLLLEKNVPRESISIEDFGELNPIYDNSTWEGKLKNRRVDIIIKPIVL